MFGLISKKAAINNDASGHIKDAGIFDSIVSNEEVPVRQLYFNQTYERLGVVVWRAFNDNPTASGGGVEGFGRRMVTFPFPKSAANPDPQLKQKLLGEVEGIFWWCWSMDDNKMFEVLKNRGNISTVAQANIENMLENQPVLEFIYQLMGNIVFKRVYFIKNIRPAWVLLSFVPFISFLLIFWYAKPSLKKGSNLVNEENTISRESTLSDLDYAEERLLKLRGMLEKGIISDEEFKELRKRTLGL